MKTIIIPTDFSENASTAVGLALHLNQETPCRLIFLYISQPDIPLKLTGQQHSDFIEKYIAEKQSELHNYTQGLGIFANANRELYHLVKISPLVSETISEVAQQHKADLIIMGTRGASGFKKIFFGSNASNVIQNSEVPVIAVPASYQGGKIHYIALATDLVNPEKKVAKVMELARLFDAHLQLVHVYPNYPEMVNLDTFDNHLFIKNLKEQMAYSHIELLFTKTNKENNLHEGLKEFVSVYKPDMMVMFTHKRSFWDKIFDGSQTEEVVYTSKVPLLAIKIQ